MPDERRQFRILYRDFLFRMVDLEVLSARGEILNLLVQFAALLAALSFVLAILFVPRYAASALSKQQLLVAAWGDEEFLIATTIGVAGLFAVMSWNAVLPDRRDSLVLGPLPVRIRTMFAAKLAAAATALGVSIAAVNIFTGLSFPVLVAGAGALGAIRSLGAYWVTMIAAGLFVFCALLALQGLAAQLVSYRLFLRMSSFLQLASFFLILGVYFLTPPLATVPGLTGPENQRLLAFLPSFWFLGLFQELNGPMHPVFGHLASRALWNLAIAFSVAATVSGLAWLRHLRRIIEQPDIVPADRSHPAARIVTFLAAKCLSKPIDRAILLFTARTIARSRQHRLLLAAYGGIGLAIALAYAKSRLYGYSKESWYQVNVPLLFGSLVLLSFTVLGVRAVFVLPISNPSSWIFRITAVYRPASYFAAVRKSLFGLTAIPVWIVSAILYFAIWPFRPALEHMAVLVLIGILLVERSLHKFRKIPFACSYLPGKANLKVALGAYGILFMFAADGGVHIEFWALHRFARFSVLFAILLAAAVWARRRTAEFARDPYNRIQFEDLPAAEVFALDLRRDGAWSGDEAYVDAIDPHFGRSLGARVRPFAIGALLLILSGIVYERVGEWRDHKRFPQIGRSFDIGGRSLNIYCSGEGEPTAILESGHSMPGFSWVLIQREIAKFTRACWYDRAGSGWSDPGPDPNWSASIARDLHKLLQAARIPPPYLLVGHSMGGFTVRVYNGLYPADVAGMVLVDSSHEDTISRIPETTTPQYLLDIQKLFLEAFGPIGLLRLSADEPDTLPRGLTREECATISSLVWQVKSQVAQVRERPLIASAEQARAAGGLGTLPLVVLTGGKSYTNPGHQKAWIELQAGLSRLSSRGRQVVVANSGHMIPFQAPQSVIEAVRDVVTEIRRDGS
jgi:pimeloyl-ACP methyl ester carboxylesterase